MRLLRLLALLVVGLLAAAVVGPAGAAACPPSRQNTLRNPLVLNTADPQISYQNGFYYLLRTEGSGVSIIQSASITGLSTATPHRVWTGSADAASRCCDIWAPELHRINGKWYVYYTADDGNIDHHNMYAIEADTTDPLGTYHFKGQLSSGSFSIDGSILQQPDGSLYLLYSKADSLNVNSLVIAPMSNPWTTSGPPVALSRPTNSWETHIRPVNEGPTVLRHKGKLFIVFSVSACESPDYSLAMLTFTGSNVLDPASWTKSTTPVFTRSDTNWVFGPGHNSFFTSPDGTEIWNAYHAVTSSNGSVVGNCGGDRSTRVQKVNWNADGTPNFGVPAASWQSMPLPSGDPGAATVATGTYRLTPQNSTSTGLDVSGCTSANATAVDIATYQGLACQQWRIRYGGNGSYTITARNSGYPLGTAGCQTARASTVDVHRAQPGDCQSWYLDPVGDGSYRVTNRLTGQVLDIGGCSGVSGTRTDIWPYWAATTGTCQQWSLQRIA
ncbi:family 43 glycosylhydrolase [Fodinicola feengrottensis]|uniref:Family 43 glycosylhydrolase n=1 Tax=Fodinicola feengrottensis TaxID=435914 RepID=A0ABN2HCA4_9ACTN